jgi:predicted 3-demethylubiquinone-9 3-methyltransferase (glyoxalase superfamily)
MTEIQTITPCLWFDCDAEAAANHYVSIFRNGRITSLSRYGEGAALPKGTAMMVMFELDGQKFQALNGGPAHAGFTEAISLSVRCADQDEVDHFWDKLSEGGMTSRCGWLKDKFGLSWQIVPAVLGTLMGGSDPDASRRVMTALMGMSKLDIAALTRARDGGTT